MTDQEHELLLTCAALVVIHAEEALMRIDGDLGCGPSPARRKWLEGTREMIQLHHKRLCALLESAGR
jgi:hypothetical protein